MADTSKYTIEERLIVSVWVHEKQQIDETYKEIRENFFLSFNKTAPSEAAITSPAPHLRLSATLDAVKS